MHNGFHVYFEAFDNNEKVLQWRLHQNTLFQDQKSKKVSGEGIVPSQTNSCSKGVGLKIEIHEIHQNLRNPVSIAGLYLLKLA